MTAVCGSVSVRGVIGDESRSAHEKMASCGAVRMATSAAPVDSYGQRVYGPVRPETEKDSRRELLDLAKRGDRDAFWTLVEPTLPRLYRACLAQCGSQADAEDLMQDALLTAWRRIATLRDGRAVGGWLAVIAVRHHVRAAKRAALRTASIDDLPDPPQTIDPLGFIEWLAELPPQQRALLILRYYYDQPLADVAQLLGLNPGTTRSRLHYLLRQLRRNVAP